jgi:hypothetical protein
LCAPSRWRWREARIATWQSSGSCWVAPLRNAERKKQKHKTKALSCSPTREFCGFVATQIIKGRSFRTEFAVLYQQNSAVSAICRSSKSIRTKERKGNDMAKAATKAKTVAKKKAPAKKPAAKKRAGKRA